ncbi:methylmalonyl-CoA mutase family protein [Aurantimonas sp. HBX-1]|uniref:methylmalonyl-CoA mutase family protein n=1 Tax=Aurantimonas sp. HBX-1 TaxID=2906072 RepID=UPI001F33F3D2|nr:methylmalonyl-CoA mutase family protein [Aurantimonas sp. HBX-1]UIJ72811.1 methylmalonyl-CoA mutase family protein [Aurantimonas sp. HBX-1]
MSAARIDPDAFPPATEADWRALVETKGRGLDGLVTDAEDGFRYGPVYARRHDAVPLARLAAGRWSIMARVDDVDPERAGGQALADLEGGASGLAVAIAGAPSSRGFGVPLDGIARALDGVRLDIAALRIEPHPQSLAALEAIASLAAAAGHDLASVSVDISLDDSAGFAASGRFAGDERDRRARIGRETQALRARGFSGRTVEADGRVYNDAGATAGQELGAVLATALYALRAMDEAGLSVAEAAGAIGFTLAVDQTQFEQTAKLRALRLLWARVLEACGESDMPPLRLHAETAWRMLSASDPHTNMLRATIAAFAAATGGADSIAILPHTAPLGLADPAARRLARNVQVILQEESGLGAVEDPAAGSGGIEALTDLTAAAGWDEFCRIEAEGGIIASLASGALQNRIAAAAAARRRALAEKRSVIIGATLYPMESERPHTVLATATPPEPDRQGERACAPLRPRRLDEEAEVAA